ncbi:MAG: glycosyltransferase family 4 protein [Bryobacteraceae bacterium]|jgi:glycosyltransferase involved in cell wall biosynthesis
MKIAIVVQGRFYAFDVARELARHHDVTVFTNYPKWAARRFGLEPSMVRSFWLHGVLTRVAERFHKTLKLSFPEAFLHRLFGRWAAARLAKENWDVIQPFSGVSEEILRSPGCRSALCIVKRASSHIRTQARLLVEEQRRTGANLDRPSTWMMAREEREYALADNVMVVSRFSYDSFLEEGFPGEKLSLLLLGAELDCFRPAPDVVEARCARILSGEPLRVLFVGALSFRKGMWDMAAILRSPAAGRFRFRLVGPVSTEVGSLARDLGGAAEFVSKQPQAELPKSHAWGDLFIFPTIEDGFPVVLAQAAAAGLPILTTPNGSGPDLIRPGESGWVLPVRSPEAFLERLEWCDTHRAELADMVRNTYRKFQPRTWETVGADFACICADLAEHRRKEALVVK